jgi:hypothetical protein
MNGCKISRRIGGIVTAGGIALFEIAEAATLNGVYFRKNTAYFHHLI